MTSLTLSNRISPNNVDDESKQMDNYQWSKSNQAATKTSRTLSCTEERIQSSSSNNNNRLKHLCTRFKRHFSISKDYRTRSEDMNRGLLARFSNYKSFSSSIDETYNEYEWPDFEKIYDSIPNCLAKALPGLGNFSIEEEGEDDDDDDTTDTTNFLTDETNEQADLFEHCKRGKNFRRNAICRKLDKSQYNGQLDKFIQQLMVEKLIRAWT
jgi:hypothetical protein